MKEVILLSSSPVLFVQSLKRCGSPSSVTAHLSYGRADLCKYLMFSTFFYQHLSFSSVQGKATKKSHSFPPMNRDHRRIIHDLAQVYGLESVSYDSEPKRNVVVTAVR